MKNIHLTIDVWKIDEESITTKAVASKGEDAIAEYQKHYFPISHDDILRKALRIAEKYWDALPADIEVRYSIWRNVG